MLVVTTNDLPGYRIIEVRGLVVGTTPRPRNKFMEGVRPLRRRSGAKASSNA